MVSGSSWWRVPPAGRVGAIQIVTDGARRISPDRTAIHRVVSIITVTDGKATHWRDYPDPIAIFDATQWPDTST